MLVAFWGTLFEAALGGEGRCTTPPADDDSTLLHVLELLASDPNGFPLAVLIVGFGVAAVRGLAAARALAAALAWTFVSLLILGEVGLALLLLCLLA